MNLLVFKSELETFLKSYITNRIEDLNFNYEIFGKEIEEIIADGLYRFFKEKLGITYDKYHLAKNKNDFPDFTLLNQFAIDYKTCQSSKPPENDLGTLRSLPKKLKLFGDHIYYIFVRYSIVDGTVCVQDIFFDKFYRFIGKSKEGLLKYREKDGNLRPKSWNDFDNQVVYWKSYETFIQAIEETSNFRRLKIIKKHLSRLKKEQKEDILDFLTKEVQD